MNLAEQTKGILDILGSGFPLHRLELILQHKEVILRWLNSKEFKDQCANHPYPPLLNPKEIIYQQTDPQVAWDFNIPLPPFDMLFICPHGVGTGATLRFLRSCEGTGRRSPHATSVIPDSAGGGGFMKHPLNVCYTEGTKFAKEYYVTHFKQFVDQKESFNVASIESYGVERMGNEKDREKFFALLPKGIPTLMQIRNPIGIVKHGIVRNWECISDIPQMTRVFNLTFDYHYFCKFLEKKEFKLPDNFESKKAQGYFYNSIIQALKPQNLTYMDMSEISKERAFDTFCRLSKIFGFDAPKEENRKIFEAQNMKGNLLFLWSLAPLQLHCHIEDVQNCYSKTKQNHSANPQIRQGSLVIFIINPNVIKGFVDIMGEFSSTLQNDVGFYIAQQDWERLHSDKKLWNAVRKYLQEFLDFLEETTREQEKRSLSEWDVLELLRKNKAARESLWNVLDLELAHIKATRPDIVASWETYLEFEKMCKKG